MMALIYAVEKVQNFPVLSIMMMAPAKSELVVAMA